MGTRPERTFLRRPIRSATQNRSRSQVAEDVNETHSGTHTISHLLGMKQQVAEKKEEPFTLLAGMESRSATKGNMVKLRKRERLRHTETWRWRTKVNRKERERKKVGDS